MGWISTTKSVAGSKLNWPFNGPLYSGRPKKPEKTSSTLRKSPDSRHSREVTLAS